MWGPSPLKYSPPLKLEKMLQFCYKEDNEGVDEKEEGKINRRTDRLCAKAGRARCPSAQSMPEDGGYGGDMLPLEEKVWWVIPSDMRRLRQLEEENVKLKKLVADLSLDKIMLQDLLSKKF